MPTVMIKGVKHTPGSNTLNKMKKKASSSTSKKKTKKKVSMAEKPPIPAKRSKKTGITVGGNRGGSNPKGTTKGGNSGNKTSTVLGIGPKAKLSTDKKTWSSKDFNRMW